MRTRPKVLSVHFQFDGMTALGRHEPVATSRSGPSSRFVLNHVIERLLGRSGQSVQRLVWAVATAQVPDRK